MSKKRAEPSLSRISTSLLYLPVRLGLNQILVDVPLPMLTGSGTGIRVVRRDTAVVSLKSGGRLLCDTGGCETMRNARDARFTKTHRAVPEAGV